jgi:uncharacterized membrane protein
MPVLVAALLLGVVAGLRTFTAPAVLWLVRHGGPIAYGLGTVAIVEYAIDLSPKAPPRTAPTGLIARLLSGGFCGFSLASAAGVSTMFGALLGACGAFIGTHAGLAARQRAISILGPIPAGLAEDAVAIAAAVAILVATPR